MVDSTTRLPTPSQTTAPLDHVVVRLRLIGQMEAWTIRSESVLPAGRKTRALLACVALAAPRPLLRGRLAEQLWSRRPEEQARASLRQEIHRLLEALSPAETEILIITRDHLTLRPGAVWIDVEEVMRATTARPASLALLDGDLLEDLDGVDPNFDAWLNTERERLRDRARTIAETMLRENPEPDAAISAAQR
jgi:DNA-binding SARP family transcriptional activator